MLSVTSIHAQETNASTQEYKLWYDRPRLLLDGIHWNSPIMHFGKINRAQINAADRTVVHRSEIDNPVIHIRY